MTKFHNKLKDIAAQLVLDVILKLYLPSKNNKSLSTVMTINSLIWPCSYCPRNKNTQYSFDIAGLIWPCNLM